MHVEEIADFARNSFYSFTSLCLGPNGWPMRNKGMVTELHKGEIFRPQSPRNCQMGDGQCPNSTATIAVKALTL
jgi:hypothetical protein